MANIAIFRINYKSDFILTLNSDAGWMTPFCIKFWTGAPSQAYFVGFDGTTYTHCAPVDGDPTKLLVQFDDHHLPIGDLKFQIAYHFNVADFPTSVEDEVLNQASVIIEVDDAPAQVMLDFNGETAPEIEFSLPAYANEAQRIANEEQRIAAEQQRIANEDARIQAEETRQQNEQQRIDQETARVNEFATLKSQSQAATRDANAAATLANEKAQLAADKAALADDAATLAIQKAQLAADKAALANDAAQLAADNAALAQQKAEYAQQQGSYAKDQGDYAKSQGKYAKEQGEIVQADHERAETDHGIAVDDHTQAGNDHTRAESDHGIAVNDHTQAGNDHTRAESDHGIAVDDHTQAGNDHTRAEADHGIAADDHTQAGNDHTRAESDHTRAESDHAAVEPFVDSLGAFDISAYHATGGVLAKYADLTAALGTNGANIPEALRKGGMSVKYAQSSDNKYVQFRYMGTETTGNPNPFLDTDNWTSGDGEFLTGEKVSEVGIDDEPIYGSENLIKSGGVYDTLFNRVEGNNKLDWSARLLHKYIDNHGVIVDNNSFCVSNAITVQKGDIIYFAQYSNKLDKYLTNVIEVCEFDSGSIFIKKTSVTISGSLSGEFLFCEITGDNTAYIRINFVPAATATDGVVFINEKLPYEPYIEPTYEPKYVSKDEAEETKEQLIEMISNVEFEKHRQVNQYSPIFVDILTDTLCKAGTGFYNLFDTSILNPNPKFDEVSEIDEEVVWHNNAWFKVSGIAGNDYVTFSESGNADMSDIVVSDNWKGAVIQNANGDYVFCLAKYKDENSLYIYPQLTENLTNVEFGQKQSDDLHLTRRGYYAYAYALFNTNIKYCEKNLYIDKYRPTDEVNPFIPYGANFAYVTRMNIESVNNYVQIGASTVPAHTCLSFGAAINDTMFQNTPFGIKWNKDIKGYKGYVEVYIGGSCAGQRVNTGITRQSGEEIFIELWLDGVLSQRIEKDTNYVERICIDYENAKEAELRIGANGIHSVDSHFIYIGAVTWWVSEMYFVSNANIFADHSIVQAFDSWGVFDDGASFNKLKEYIDAFTEMNNEMYNLSSGGKTSLYWKHWFSATIKPKEPSLVISDYGINDYKGPEYAGNVVAPDGTVYPNTNDKGDYVDNMTHCIKMNMNHGFLPVVCSSGLHENGYINEWYQAVIDNLAKKVNL